MEIPSTYPAEEVGVKCYVSSIAANAFTATTCRGDDAKYKSKFADAAVLVNKIRIDYSDEFPDAITIDNNAFGSLTGVTEVENLTPGAKISDISENSFTTAVYKKPLTVPTENMGKYATKTGWKNFEKIQDGTGHLLGNLNTDTKITTADLSLLVNAVIEENIKPTNSLFPYYNMNGDSKITTADISILVDILNRD